MIGGIDGHSYEEILRRALMVLERKGDEGRIYQKERVRVTTVVENGIYITRLQRRQFRFRGWSYCPKGKKARKHITLTDITIGALDGFHDEVFRFTNENPELNFCIPGEWQDDLDDVYKEVTE